MAVPTLNPVLENSSEVVDQPQSTSKSNDREKRWWEIYQQLDINSDGKIDFKELMDALQKRMRKEHAQSIANRLFRKKGVKQETPDCTLDFKEFVERMAEHESSLTLVFNEIDVNKDGFVDSNELKNYMNKLGVFTSDQEAENIVSKMRVSNQAVVNLETFKNYLILNPSSDPLELAKFWQHSLIVDTGEDTLVPEEFTLSDYQPNTWWKHLLAGGIAGGVSRSFTAPLDRLKIFLQVHSNRNHRIGFISGFKMLVNEGGVRSMWRGNGVNLLKIAPETALKFTFYEKIKKMIKGDRTDDLTILERLLSGSMAGASAQTLIYPMEVLKTRLALRKTHRLNKGIWDAARQIYLKEGAKAFYRGYVPNLCGIAPYAGIDLAVYETLKLLYIKHNKSGKEDPSVFVLLACGGFSAVCGQFSSYPLALIKTKLQANVQAKSSMSNQPITMIGQFKYIFKTEGIFGFYRGLAPGVVKIVPAVSISYVIYELLRKQLGATMS